MACLDCDIDISSCGPYANKGDVIRELEAICSVIENSDCSRTANITSNTNYCDNTIINTVWPEGAPDVDCCPYLTVYAADGSCMWTRANGFTSCWIKICSQENDCTAVVPDGTDPNDFYDIGFPSGCNPECNVLIVTYAGSGAQWIARSCSNDWQLITNFDCWADTNTTLPIADYCNTLFTSDQRQFCNGLVVITYDAGVAVQACQFNNDGSDCTNPNNWACGTTTTDCAAVEACPNVFTSCLDVVPCLPIADCADVRACLVDNGCAAWGDNTAAPFSQIYTADTVVVANLGLTAGSYGAGCVSVNHAAGQITFLTTGLYCISASLQGRMQSASCADFSNTRIDFSFNGPASYSYQTALYGNDHINTNSILSISVCFYVTIPGSIGTFYLAGAGPALTTCAIEAAVQFWSVVRMA